MLCPISPILSYSMKSHDSHAGKILLHGADAGEITPSMIERRAYELAIIEGRSAVSPSDRRLARQELQGRELPRTMSDDSASIALALTRDPSEPASVPGHQTPVPDEGDDQDMVERLALEGVEEAQHDQMLAASRRKIL